MKNDLEDFYDELKAMHIEDDRVNTRLTKALLSVMGFHWVAKFLKDFTESECNGVISFVNKPRGEKQNDYWGATVGVYVEQYNSFEDSYSGNIYFPIKDGKYLKCHFDC